jgi:hypothetical protein
LIGLGIYDAKPRRAIDAHEDSIAVIQLVDPHVSEAGAGANGEKAVAIPSQSCNLSQGSAGVEVGISTNGDGFRQLGNC